MKKVVTLLVCSVLLIITTSATNPSKIYNPVKSYHKTRHITALTAPAFFVNAYDVAYHAVYNGSGYDVTLYFLAITSPNYTLAAAPVPITVTGTIGSYTGSVTIPQGASTYFLGTFPSISGGITSVSPTSIGGLPVYHDQPPGW